ncbi:MAG: heme o synthase [Acetobacteraceae bacterium]|nr:heme o synthase [Acetobacteraceae bacterium]
MPDGGAHPIPAREAAFRVASSEVGDWIALLKPRVMTLVVFTGLVGLLVAPGSLHPALGAVAVLCIAVGAGAAGAINMWYDRDIDSVMRRTAARPIPAGRIDPAAALGYGVTLAVAAVVVLGLATNWVAAGILAFSIWFYAVVYTMWLKRRTPQNIVIGGAAGAFPPVIGWAAVTGDVSLVPLLLFAVIFLWTPPHFWALSLFAHGDYARAGVPMLPVVAGARRTRRAIVAYAAVLAPLGASPWLVGFASAAYGVAALALGLWFLAACVGVLREAQDPAGVSLAGDAAAKRAFRVSILYLFGLFGALALDVLILRGTGG